MDVLSVFLTSDKKKIVFCALIDHRELSLLFLVCKCIEIPTVGPVYSLAALVITWRNNNDENEWIHNNEDNLILHKKDSDSSCCLWHGYAFNGHNFND